LPVGYSDHSEGPGAALAAVALGATVLEKHITFDRDAPGPDHLASMLPEAFTAYVKAIRELEQMLGDGIKAPHSSELNTLAVARRSIVAATTLLPGHVLAREDLQMRRPAGGLEPAQAEALVGRKLARGLLAGEALAWDQLEAAK
ncbi:MAG: N-acetylneuraminate synthase family protein, partial [Ramlibacter sp.]